MTCIIFLIIAIFIYGFALGQVKTQKVKKFLTVHGSTDNIQNYMLSLTDEQFKLMFGAK